MRLRGFGSTLLIAVLTAGSACAGGRVNAAPPPGPIAQDLPQLVRAAALVVVGQIAGIRSGRVAGSGEGRLQFNDVRVSVERAVKGNPPASIVLEQVAGAGPSVSSEVGPPYKTGERYILFLREGEGHRHVVLPQGRFRLERGTVHPIGPGPAAQVKDADATRFLQEIQAVLQDKSP